MHTWGGLTVCHKANAHSDVRADCEKSAEAIVPHRVPKKELWEGPNANHVPTDSEV